MESSQIEVKLAVLETLIRGQTAAVAEQTEAIDDLSKRMRALEGWRAFVYGVCAAVGVAVGWISAVFGAHK